VNCTNITIEAGQSAAITCSTDPAGAALSLGTASSQIGGTITVEGNQVHYRAPSEGSGEDTFTVIASAPDYEDGRTALTVRVTPTAGSTESPAPSQPTETPSPSPNSTASAPPEEAPAPPQDAENDAGPPTEAETPEVENPPANEPTASASPPGAPSTPDAREPGDAVLLPVPGMPSLPELAIPGVSHEPEPENSLEATDDHHYDSLAATGTSAAFGAAGLGVLTLALGAGMLFTSRRLR
jgi:hypothetical protein